MNYFPKWAGVSVNENSGERFKLSEVLKDYNLL